MWLSVEFFNGHIRLKYRNYLATLQDQTDVKTNKQSLDNIGYTICEI